MPFTLGRMGSVAGAWDVTEGGLATLKNWLPEAVRQLNASGFTTVSGPMVPPMNYDTIPVEQIDMSTDQVPAVFVSSTGTVDRPAKVGTGSSYSSWYSLNVAAVDRDQDWASTVKRVQVWAALIRGVILSNLSLSGIVEDTVWRGETFGVIPSDENRTYAGVAVAFQCLLPNVSIPGDIGPLTPPPGDIGSDGFTPFLPAGTTVLSFEEDYQHGPLP